jgi:hypothetical protein
MFKLSASFILIIACYSCGSSQKDEPAANFPPPIPPSKAFGQVTALTNQFCLKCHLNSGFLKTENQWRASDARARLTARTMPQVGSNEAKVLSDKDRSFLISF